MGTKNLDTMSVILGEKKYFLGDKAKNIFASKYQLHLPTEKELEEELKKEKGVSEIEDSFESGKKELRCRRRAG